MLRTPMYSGNLHYPVAKRVACLFRLEQAKNFVYLICIFIVHRKLYHVCCNITSFRLCSVFYDKNICLMYFAYACLMQTVHYSKTKCMLYLCLLLTAMTPACCCLQLLETVYYLPYTTTQCHVTIECLIQPASICFSFCIIDVILFGHHELMK